MSVYLRNKIFWVDYYFEGKRRREKVGADRRLAELALQKRKIEIAEGRFLDKKRTEKILFEDFADTFLELHSKINKKPRVYIRDKSLIRHLNEFLIGKHLHEITPMDIERYKAERSKKVNVATVNREVACLKCILNKAIEWGKTTVNPVRKVKLFKENNKRTRYLECEEINKLIEASSGHIKSIITVAVNTGMRKSEILNLKWENVDLDKGIIYLLDTKNGEKREVKANESVKKVLKEMAQKSGSDYVFCNRKERPFQDIRKSFSTVLGRCGIINFRFHDLRHTFASQLVMLGVDIKTVQELMGHKTIEMTLRYSHLSPDHKNKAIELLGKKIDSAKARTVTKWSQTDFVTTDKENSNLHKSLIGKELELVVL